jgi:membrane-associated phospholipid phosphatase
VTTRTSARALAAAFTLADVIMFAYLVAMSALVWRASPGPAREPCAHELYLHVALLIVGCLGARSADLPPRVSAVFYRIVLAGLLLHNYLMLRDLLPLVRPDSMDSSLLAADVRLFGGEPSLWLERYNRRPIVEWFAFFYFSYFCLALTYFVAVVCLSRASRATAEFAIGTLLVFCIGQLGYIAVPGWGPIRFLADRFASPIHGGFFWALVTQTVRAGSALKDIFPSLHTAVPTWFTCFAVIQARRDPRWRWPAVITGFFAANIIVSTMLLRWHYAIDVCAGLALALTVGALTPRIARAEEAFRARAGLQGSWSFGADRQG